MLGYIREEKTPKEGLENLKKIFAANTTTRKLQLRQELNNIQLRDMSITSYTLKIKELCYALGSIDDSEMVQICLGGLAPRFNTMRTAVLARKNTPSFFDLQSILLVEENHARQRCNIPEGQMLYSQSDDRRNLGRGNRGKLGQGRNGWQTQGRNPDQWQADRNHPREFGRRGGYHVGPSRRNHPSKCGYCGKYGQYEEECRKKACDSVSTGRLLRKGQKYNII